MLIAALALSIGLAIYDLTAREIDLSDTATQSQYAIYAADTGAECVLYWDNKYNGSSSAFATSSATAPPSSGIDCVNQDVAALGTAPIPYVVPVSSANGWKAWSVQASSTGAITAFTVVIGSAATSPCAVVEIEKYESGGALYTTVISSGYNTCGVSAIRVERTLQVSY